MTIFVTSLMSVLHIYQILETFLSLRIKEVDHENKEMNNKKDRKQEISRMSRRDRKVSPLTGYDVRVFIDSVQSQLLKILKYQLLFSTNYTIFI